MASITKEIHLTQTAATVWDAVADFGAVHTRLAEGFVKAAHIEGDARLLTFSNGNMARERLVDCDGNARRLVYAISNERVEHYNAVVQVFNDGADNCRLVWTVDFLPNAIEPYIGSQMDLAASAMETTLNKS